MQFKKIIILFLSLTLLLSIIICSIGNNSLDSQLDDLEKIIEKYEPKFKSIEYGSQSYNDMIPKYNQEISDWASIFESDRYEKGLDGKMVSKQEFKDVEKRFYELNGRMTKMVLATIPKVERPSSVELDNNNKE